MARYTLLQKPANLSDAAKYDAFCASNGGTRRDSSDGKGLGLIEGHGICHAYAPDGRCISLLKIKAPAVALPAEHGTLAGSLDELHS